MKRAIVCIVAAAFLAVLGQTAAEAKEAKLMLFGFDANAAEDLSSVQAGIATMLPGRLSMPGQLAVIDQGAPAAAGQKARVIPPAEQLAIAKKAGADYLLAGTITKLGAVISIDARLVGTGASDSPTPISVQSNGMDNIIAQLNVLAQKARNAILEKAEPQAGLAGPSSAFTFDNEPYPQHRRRSMAYKTPDDEPEDLPPPPGPRRPMGKPSRLDSDKPKRNYGAGPGVLFSSSPAFSASVTGKPFHCICAGDVNGDGKRELIAAGPELISIYQVAGTTLTKIGEVPVKIDEHVVHIDAGDFNGNGIDELYVSSYETQNARSFIVEFQQNNYVRIAERQRWFYRAYNLSDGTVRLIGQEAGTISPFSGDMFLMEWKEGKLVSREQFILPGGRDIYGFGEGDVDADGVTDFLIFDRGLFNTQPELIMASTTSKIVWRDTKKLGGTPNFFSKYTTGNEMEQKEYVSLRIICTDTTTDGRWAVIVGRNSRSGDGIASKLFDYNQGQVQCLLWDGADLSPNWVSPMMHDVVNDYILDDIDKDGARELVILSTKSEGFMGSCANTLTAYRQKK